MSAPRSGVPAPAGPSRWLAVRSGFVDRVVALVLLPVLAPVVGVLAWRVHRHDGSPVLIGLDRVGRGGITFRMWKLRSMRVEGADGLAGGAVITATDDDRITPIGRRLRAWRLDELPQVVNVLRGEMALVGPRPETPSLVDLDDPRWEAVLRARPGITGPTQLVVERWEAATLAAGEQDDRYRTRILPVKLAVDRWYVEGASLRTDLRTAWSMVQRFALGRDETTIQADARRAVPEVAVVPVGAIEAIGPTGAGPSPATS